MSRAKTGTSLRDRMAVLEAETMPKTYRQPSMGLLKLQQAAMQRDSSDESEDEVGSELSATKSAPPKTKAVTTTTSASSISVDDSALDSGSPAKPSLSTASKSPATRKKKVSVRDAALAKLKKKVDSSSAEDGSAAATRDWMPPVGTRARVQSLHESTGAWKSSYYGHGDGAKELHGLMQTRVRAQSDAGSRITHRAAALKDRASASLWRDDYYAAGDGAKELAELKEQRERVEVDGSAIGARKMVYKTETESDRWRDDYYSSKDGRVLQGEIEELKAMGISELIATHLARFSHLDSEGNDLFRKELKKIKMADKKELLLLQIRKMHTRFTEEYELSVAESNEIVTSMPAADIDTALEIAFSDRIETYNEELVALQRRFEERVTFFKDFRAERDVKYELTEEKKDEMRRVMEEEMLKRRTKLDDLKFVDSVMKQAFALKKKKKKGAAAEIEFVEEGSGEATADGLVTEVLVREKACYILRELGVLIEDDTVIQMSATSLFAKLVDSKRESLKQVLHWAIEDNPRLLSLQMAALKVTDHWFVATLMPILRDHCKMLTELNLESNPLTDKSVYALADYLATNPPNLRVVKLVNLERDISTECLTYLCDKLETNRTICKFSIDTRFFHHRDRIQKQCDCNFKKFAKLRRLKRTLLGDIKKKPGLENPTPLSDS